jgi:serine/threonine protein kinase
MGAGEVREDSPRWQDVGPPATPAEAEALRALKALLPDAPTTYAWSNVSFIDTSGRTAEVDLILVTRAGLFVVELKGWHGRIAGNQVTWRRDDGSSVENPLLLTDRKAKRLVSLLGYLQQGRKPVKLPFIRPLVVLHGKNSKVDLDAVAKTGVVGLDGYAVAGVPTLSQWLAEGPSDERDAVDKARATQIAELLKAAGFAAIPRTRMVGNYAVDRGQPFDEGPSWRDVIAENPGLPDVRRRIRLYDVPLGSSSEERARIRRTAQRELLLTQGLQHPGVIRPLDLFDSEIGPALVFEHDATALPLARWLQQHPDATLDQRLGLVRQLGEVLRYAHGRQITHRALTPRQVHVVPEPGGTLRLTVRDWQTGRESAHDTGTTTGLTGATLMGGTRHVADLAAQETWTYLAPEVHALHGSDGVAADVFGLGAISYLILTSEPPSTTLADYEQRMRDGHGFDPGLVLDGYPEPLRQLVSRATHPNPALDRTPSVDAFLAELDSVERELNAAAQLEEALDPIEAQVGDGLDLDGNYHLVTERLGSGSTGLALLVEDGEEHQRVLKVAHDAARGRRLDDEHAVLVALDSPRIARPVREPFDVAGRRCLLLENAGLPTLGTRIRDEGRLTLDQLERYGADLLEAVAHLDERGIFHRDIKPDNLGVRPSPGDRKPRLVLFDFSLSRESLDHVKAGTPPFLDPFLGGRERPRYDRAAERYAVAVTLFVMATGQVPQWGGGDVDPAVVEDEVTLVADMFEPSVADAMIAFFRTALARDARRRFGDLADLAQAWSAIFRQADTRLDSTTPDDLLAASDAAAEAAGLTTPLSEAGLSARAVSVATRLGVTTVAELLALNPMRINQVPGSGDATRRELQRRLREWRRRLDAGTVEPAPVVDDTATRAVDALVRGLMPGSNGRNHASISAARLVLGLPVEHEGDAAYLTPQPWPSLTEISTVLGVTRARVSQIVDTLRPAWAKSTAEVLDEVVAALESQQGVAEAGELARVLLATHGSLAEGEARMRQALGLLRAVIEGDAARGGDARLVARRVGDAVLVGLEPSDPLAPAADNRLDYVRALGDVADRIAAQVPHRSEALDALRRVTIPEGVVPFTDDRLVQLAASASRSAAVSARGEVYPRGLDPARAIALTLAGLTLRGAPLPPALLGQRVRTRFPEAAPLPERPALDRLVEAAGLQWDGQAYTAPTEVTANLLQTAHASTVLGTASVGAVPYDEVDTRLRRSLETASYLTLAVDPRHADDAANTLASTYGVARVDLAAELMSALRALTDGKVDWRLVLDSDARPPGSPDRDQLEAAVSQALAQHLPRVLADPRPLVLTSPGLLGRYRATSWLAQLADLATPRPAARWLLVPMRAAAAAPVLDDNQPVPLGSDGWLALPPELTTPPTSTRAEPAS